LSSLDRKEKKEKEQLRQKLIEGYKSNARNKKLQKELGMLEKASLEDIFGKKIPKRGEIWLLKNLDKIKEFGKDYRPVMVISNDEQNEYDGKIASVPLTTEEVEEVKIFEVLLIILPRMD
jgi:uncharacterized protein YnzC (UPF0291/DUF896 family)